MRRILLSLLAVSVLSFVSISGQQKAKTQPAKNAKTAKSTPFKSTDGMTETVKSTTGIFGKEKCAPDGTGPGDHDLSTLKNRDIPPDRYEPIGLATIIKNVPTDAKAMGKKARAKWTDEALAEVRKWEDKGASVQGYIKEYKHEGTEGCNCKNEIHKDYHLWLVGSAGDLKVKGMVIEISPRLLDAHPNWVSQLASLKKHATLVRISGWLTWDQEHPSEVGKSKATLWEIHPIHKIEVLDQDNKWKSLDEN